MREDFKRHIVGTLSEEVYWRGLLKKFTEEVYYRKPLTFRPNEVELIQLTKASC